MAIWDIKERYNLVRGNIGALRPSVGFNFDDGSTQIQKINIRSLGDATNFSDLSKNCTGGGAAGTETRYIHGGGLQPTTSNIIVHGIFASAGNAADFGDLTDGRQMLQCVSNHVRCVWGGGRQNPGSDGYTTRNIIDSVHFSSLGNAVDFGDLSVARFGIGTAQSSTRGIWAGGAPSPTNVIDFVQIATTGNAADFGDLTAAEDYFAGFSTGVRASFIGGPDTDIQTVNIPSTGNTVDYGTLSGSSRFGLASCDNSTRGVFMGGQDRASPGASNARMDTFELDTGGATTDFGDLTANSGFKVSGCGNGSGGLDFGLVQRPSVNFSGDYSSFMSSTGPAAGRALHMGGGNPNTSAVDMFHIPTLGNASDFGNLVTARAQQTSCANRTRSMCVGGEISAPSPSDQVDYVEMISQGNFADFGNLATAVRLPSACANSTRAVNMSGTNPSSSAGNVVQYVVMATVGNWSDFGDLTVGRHSGGNVASPTRAVCMGGKVSGGTSNVMDYVTIASTGNATDFGDLTLSRSSGGNLSSNVRGVFGGGYTPTYQNIIDYITIASTGDASDFGDLLAATNQPAGTSNSTRGLIMGGYQPGISNIIQHITIASTGDAADFGDLIVNRAYMGASSDSGGGILQS